MIQHLPDTVKSEEPLQNPETRSDEQLWLLGERRHEENRAWFMSDRSLWKGRNNKVVAVYNKAVIGEGDDGLAAYDDAFARCAAKSELCPHPYDVTFVDVPPELPDLPLTPDWSLDGSEISIDRPAEG